MYIAPHMLTHWLFDVYEGFIKAEVGKWTDERMSF